MEETRDNFVDIIQDLGSLYESIKRWRANQDANNAEIEIGATDSGKLDAILTRLRLKEQKAEIKLAESKLLKDSEKLNRERQIRIQQKIANIKST